jgi:hypothetical protein
MVLGGGLVKEGGDGDGTVMVMLAGFWFERIYIRFERWCRAAARASAY